MIENVNLIKIIYYIDIYSKHDVSESSIRKPVSDNDFFKVFGIVIILLFFKNLNLFFKISIFFCIFKSF